MPGNERERHTSGPLTVASLASALECLRPTGGHVAVSDGRREAYFVFTMAGVRIVVSGFAPPSLSQWLVLGGYVDETQQEALAKAHRSGQDERETLVELGISPDSIREGARSLGVQLLLDCLFWPKAHFEAGSGRPYYLERLKRDGVSERTLPTPLKNMLQDIHTALREVAGARGTFPTLDVSLVTTSSEGARARQEASGDGLEKHLLECLLSRPGISAHELRAMLGCGEAAVMRRVHDLSAAGLLTADPRPPAREEWEGRAAATREHLEAQPINQLVLRLALAALLQQLEDPSAAARQLDRAGWLLFGQRRHDEALEAFNEALALAPTDLEALQGRVSSLTSLERGRAAAEAAVDLGQRYLEHGLPNQAKLVLAQA
ncbi:MAG: tetratricopeptide repeat protein [Planctomycetota bacterium]